MDDAYLQRVRSNMLALCKGDETAYERIRNFMLRFGDGASYKGNSTASSSYINPKKTHLEQLTYCVFVKHDTAWVTVQSVNILLGVKELCNEVSYIYYTLKELVAHDFVTLNIKKKLCSTAFCVVLREEGNKDPTAPVDPVRKKPGPKPKNKDLPAVPSAAPAASPVDHVRKKPGPKPKNNSLAALAAVVVPIRKKPGPKPKNKAMLAPVVPIRKKPGPKPKLAPDSLAALAAIAAPCDHVDHASAKRKLEFAELQSTKKMRQCAPESYIDKHIMYVTFTTIGNNQLNEGDDAIVFIFVFTFIILFSTGVVNAYDEKTNMFSIKFDGNSDTTYATPDETIEHLQNTDFYFSAGVIKKICAKIIEPNEMFLCSCNKIRDIPVAMPYKFNNDAFEFDLEMVGDTIMIDKNNFNYSCSSLLNFEIIAKDQKGDIYVSERLSKWYVYIVLTTLLCFTGQIQIHHV